MLSRDKETGAIVVHLGRRESIWFPLRCEVAYLVPRVVDAWRFVHKVFDASILIPSALFICLLYKTNLLQRARAALWMDRLGGWFGLESLSEALDHWDGV